MAEDDRRNETDGLSGPQTGGKVNRADIAAGDDNGLPDLPGDHDAAEGLQGAPDSGHTGPEANDKNPGSVIRELGAGMGPGDTHGSTGASERHGGRSNSQGGANGPGERVDIGGTGTEGGIGGATGGTPGAGSDATTRGFGQPAPTEGDLGGRRGTGDVSGLGGNDHG